MQAWAYDHHIDTEVIIIKQILSTVSVLHNQVKETFSDQTSNHVYTETFSLKTTENAKGVTVFATVLRKRE